ncbi:Uncharacterized HTH-type transcriptional regulator YddM [Klebsiella pneumoniae]|nr:Uncharacterized HTH-type transcriptional regulator YddM [Klebsiella pneumoniae]
MINVFNPMHPGEYIREVYKADLSVDMAFRLSKVLGRSPESWINLQTQYSLDKARKESADNFSVLRPIPL